MPHSQIVKARRNTKAKTPMGGLPYANPHTSDEYLANLREALKRRDECETARDAALAKIREEAPDGFLQRMVTLRDEAEKQNGFVLALTKMIDHLGVMSRAGL